MLLCKSTKENYRRGLAAQSEPWSSSVCLGKASLLSWLAFHFAEERGSRPPSEGLSRAHVSGPQSSAQSFREGRHGDPNQPVLGVRDFSRLPIQNLRNHLVFQEDTKER